AGNADTFDLTTTAGSNGFIQVAGGVVAGTINLTAGGSGSISRVSSFSLQGDTINLATGSGSIGSAATGLLTLANALATNTVRANAGGDVFISNAGPAILGQSMSARSFNFTSTGPSGSLTVSGPLSTVNGSASLIASSG